MGCLETGCTQANLKAIRERLKLPGLGRGLACFAIMQLAETTIEAAGPSLVKPGPNREAVKAVVIFAPWEFNDAQGTFVVQRELDEWWSWNWHAWKLYTGGSMKGQTVAITNDEYRAFKAEGNKRWGYIQTNWFGPDEFVPGTERKELPMEMPDRNPNRT